MTTRTFAYQAVRKDKESQELTSLIAYSAPAKAPLWAVLWSVPRQTWTFAPAIAAGLLYDDQYRNEVFPVSRDTAERIAREHLGTDLPPEEELLRICEEGERLNQPWGPMTPA